MTEKQEQEQPADQAEGKRASVPKPEQGSPQEGEEHAGGEAAKRTEKGEESDPNPLAPPVNTQAGS